MRGVTEEYLLRRGRSVRPSTLRHERSTVLKLAQWWDRTRRAPSSLDRSGLDDFLHEPGGLREGRRGIELGNNSYNKCLEHLKPFIDYLALHHRVSPALKQQLREAHLTPTTVEYLRLSLQQLHGLIEGAEDPWSRWVLAFGSFSLGRAGELRRSRLGHWDLQSGFVSWYRSKTDDYDRLPIFGDLDREYRRWLIAYEGTTGQKLTGDCYAIPGRWRSRWEGTLRLRPAQPSSDIAMQRMVKRSVARVLDISFESINNEAMHILRRSGGLALYNQLRDAGVQDPLRVVMAMMGHTRVSTTEGYLGLRADRERRDDLLRGSTIMSLPKTNVIELVRDA